MFNFSDDTNDLSFKWDDIGSVGLGRENLGEEMPVFVYRLLEFTLKQAMIKKIGKEAAIEIFREAGETSGREFATHLLDMSLPFNEFMSQLQQVLEKSKIGVLRLERFDQESGFAVLTVAEDLDCSGIPVTGETVCNYDEGFFAGILKLYTKRHYVVTEVDCWSTGSRVCRFEAKVTT